MTNSRNNLLKENENLYFPSLLEQARTLWAWGQARHGKVRRTGNTGGRRPKREGLSTIQMPDTGQCDRSPPTKVASTVRLAHAMPSWMDYTCVDSDSFSEKWSVAICSHCVLFSVGKSMCLAVLAQKNLVWSLCQGPLPKFWKSQFIPQPRNQFLWPLTSLQQ